MLSGKISNQGFPAQHDHIGNPQNEEEGKMKFKLLMLVAISLVTALTGLNTVQAEEAVLESVTIKLHTLDDDKDKEEAIDLAIRYINTTYASTSVGGGELWRDHTSKEIALEIKPALSIGKAERAFLTLYKRPHGSETGCGWNARIEVIGHLSDGRDVTLVSSGGMRIGDNNAYDLKFNFGRIQ